MPWLMQVPLNLVEFVVDRFLALDVLAVAVAHDTPSLQPVCRSVARPTLRRRLATREPSPVEVADSCQLPINFCHRN